MVQLFLGSWNASLSFGRNVDTVLEMITANDTVFDVSSENPTSSVFPSRQIWCWGFGTLETTVKEGTSRQCWQNQGPRQNREFMQQIRNRKSRQPWVFKAGAEGSIRGWMNSLSHSNIAVHPLNRASVALVLGGEVSGSVTEWSCLWGKSWVSTTLDSESSQERRRMGWNCLLVGCVKPLWSSSGNLESINWIILWTPDYARYCGGHILRCSMELIESHNFRDLKSLWSNLFLGSCSRRILEGSTICNVNHEDIT